MAVPFVAAGAADAVARRRTAPAKARPYSGGSRTNIRPPGDPEPPAAPSPTPPAAPADVPRAEPADSDGTAGPQTREPTSSPSGFRGLPAAPAAVRDGSGIALGFLLWVWVVLPYLDGGTARVKQVLAAKFLNQTTE